MGLDHDSATALWMLALPRAVSREVFGLLNRILSQWITYMKGLEQQLLEDDNRVVDQNLCLSLSMEETQV